MRGVGIAIVPCSPMPCGRWLDATRAGSLQRVANRPILSHVLDALLEAGVAEAAVLTPSVLAADVETCVRTEAPRGATVRVLSCDGRTGPEGCLRAVADFAGDRPAIVHRADGLHDAPLAGMLDSLLAVGGPEALLLVAQDVREEQRLQPAVRRALRLAEIGTSAAPLGLAGVCALAPGVLRELAAAPGAMQGLEPADLPEVLAARAAGRLEVRVVHEWRAFTGEATDLLDVNRIALDRIGTDIPPDGRRGNRIEGRVQIDGSATVGSSVIYGPAIIGAGAVVRDSYIGPHTSIGERVRLEGAEIEQSIVYSGACVLHVGGRLVASVVGRDAKVFRDFSVPRAMRLQVGDGNRVALC
jgi:glucose-1-phosphate thymidylyltransferase